MFELRTYTLGSATALQQYATKHWTRHIPSLEKFGITTHGVWTEHNTDTYRLIALVSYPENADPTQLSNEYMSSPEFLADMDGFNMHDILAVDSVLLDIAPISPRI